MRFSLPSVLALVAVSLCTASSPAEETLQKFHPCTLQETDWSDGDSFPVLFPDGRRATVRLYGADCIEWHVNDETDARRLRAQRRYFGIRGGEAADSMRAARDFGKRAAERTRQALSEPFTIHTAFSGARGASEGGRIYAFATTARGDDLATLLVKEGLARAFGITRLTPSGSSGAEYRATLADWELTAAAEKRGIWSLTDWTSLASDRAAERRENSELASILAPSTRKGGIDPNTATQEELKALPGIGPVLAKRIIAHRQTGRFQKVQDLQKIPGFGTKQIQNLEEWLVFP